LFIFLCGPASVGKTTMQNYTFQRDKVRAPILNLLARPPLHGPFSWKEFLHSGISTLEQPLVSRKGTFDRDDDEENTQLVQPFESWSENRPLKRIKDDDLRISLETTIKRQRPAAVLIDDAQYLGRVSGGQQLQNQVDCLKSLAEITETVYVLIGTYELLNLHSVSAQATARSIFIHFPRYGSTDEELSQFKDVLSMFQDLLPFEAETDVLLKHWEYCYERSLGCVGILHIMLTRAVHAALWSDEKTLSQRYLERNALSEAECYVMMRENYEAEGELAHRSAPTPLRKMLGLTPLTTFSTDMPATRSRAPFQRSER
jgi:AAA domain